MVEIEFSVMENSAGDAQRLRPLLDNFEKQHHVRVKLLGIPWHQGWTEIAKFGIYGNGPDISSIGTTWVGSLAAMQALHPFSDQQVRGIGGAESYFESNWNSGFMPGDPRPWSIPWLGDAMVLYYWRDMFEQAGIQDPAAALATEDRILETLRALQATGISHPLSLNVASDPVILHETAHWVWNAGGDFLSTDHRRVAFNEPAALTGLRDYFRLQPFIAPDALAGHPGEIAFTQRRSALQAAGPWLGMIGRQQHPEWGDSLGVARLPGQAWAGGTNLVIWRYSLHTDAAFELIHFLSHQPIQFPASPHDQLVPVRREALDMPITRQDPFNSAYLETLLAGKSFPSIRLWGAVEDKLIPVIAAIWAERYANPDGDIDACLHKHLDPLAKRLNIVLDN